MESPPLLILKSIRKEECEEIIENARSEDIFDVELVTTQKSNDGMQFFLFEVDTTEPNEAVRFCQSICSANENINLWCFMDEEPEQFLVKGSKGEVHTIVYEVEIDGIPCAEDDGSYGKWHHGLPDDWHYGAHAPPPATSDAGTEKLFEKIYEALGQGKPVTDFVPQIRAAKNVNFVNRDGQDAFTFVFDFGEPSRPECVSVFKAMLDSGYDVHRVIDGLPFIARVFSVVSKSFLDRPIEQSSRAHRFRTKLGLGKDENPAYEATLKNMQEVLDLTLKAGANINLGVEEDLGADRNIKPFEEVLPADRDYASDEDRRYYVPVINAIAGHYYCPPEMYIQLLPFCTKEILEWVLEVDAYNVEDDIDSAIPTEAIAKIRKLSSS